jgi:hypothetical protein
LLRCRKFGSAAFFCVILSIKLNIGLVAVLLLANRWFLVSIYSYLLFVLVFIDAKESIFDF